MKKSILFGAPLIIVTLLCSCNNSERYHYSGSSVCDSKTGKVYILDAKAEYTWDPINKTLTFNKIKRLNYPKKLADKSENQPQLNNFEGLVKTLYTTFKKDLTPEKFQYIMSHYGNGKETDFVKDFYTTFKIPLTQKKMDYIQSHYLSFGSGYQFPLPGSSQEKGNANRDK